MYYIIYKCYYTITHKRYNYLYCYRIILTKDSKSLSLFIKL